MDPDVPLIVPEVNSHDLKNYKKKNIIANANCSVIPLVVALKPLHDLYKLKELLPQLINLFLELVKHQWMNCYLKQKIFLKIKN